MVLYTHHLFATKISQELLLCLGTTVTVTATVSGPLPFYFSDLTTEITEHFIDDWNPYLRGSYDHVGSLALFWTNNARCQPHMTYDC